MIDITSALNRALDSKDEWSTDQSVSLANIVVGRVPGTRIDWDRGAGEDWIRVLCVSRPIAMLYTTFPLVIIESSVWAAVIDNGAPFESLAIRINDFDSKELCARAETLAACFGVQCGRIEPDGFSANHLWWATV